jgi:hypothetical protein
VTYGEYQTRIVAELYRLFESRGRGTMAAVQRRLGVGHSYFGNWRYHSSRINHRKLLAALDLLAVEPAEFFYAALRPEVEEARTEKRVTAMEPEAERYRVEEALRVARRATETG